MKMQFPISIVLVGAPGSGKSAVAEEFEKISADYFAENDSPFAVIDNAGNHLQNDLDTPMGVFGGYHEDLRAYYLQYEAEQEAKLNGLSYITLGNSLENLAHAGVTLENILTGVQTPEAARRGQQQQVTMSLLTFQFLERFRYSFGFWIPFAGAGLVLPGADDNERQYNQRIDMALRTIFVNFGVRIQALEEPSVEEKAATMLETVKRVMENGPEIPDPVEMAEEDGALPPVSESTLAE